MTTQMKKYSFLFLAAAFGFAGCTNSDSTDTAPRRPKMQITASANQGEIMVDGQPKSVSRAIMNDYYTPVWLEEDYITVSTKGTGEFYLNVDTINEDGSYATFAGAADVDIEAGTYDFYAAHNALEVVVTEDSAEAVFEIPSIQYGAADLLAVSTNKSVEVTGTNIGLHFDFNIINSFLRIDMSSFTQDNDIVSVLLQTIDKKPVAGTYIYDYATGEASIVNDENASSHIKLVPDQDVFYFVLPADITFSQGFLLIFENRKGEHMVLKTGTGKEFARAKYYTTPALTNFVNSLAIENLLTARTSYSDYLDGNIDEANAWTPNDIRIFGEIKYSNTSGGKLTIEQKGYAVNGKYYEHTGETITTDNIEQPGQYEVQAYVMDQYGNYYVSTTKLAYITGLPYKLADYGAVGWSDQWDGWSLSSPTSARITQSSSGVSLTLTSNTAKGTVKSSEFEFPDAGTKVDFFLRGTATNQTTLNIAIDGVTFVSINKSGIKGEKDGTVTAGKSMQVTGIGAVASGGSASAQAPQIVTVNEATLTYAK